MEEFTLVRGKKYKAKIHLPGFQDYASNDKIADMLTEYGFTDIEVTGEGRSREGTATWSGETVTGPMDRRIVSVEEVKEEVKEPPIPAVDPLPIPDSPPVFEKPEAAPKKASLRQEEDEE